MISAVVADQEAHLADRAAHEDELWSVLCELLGANKMVEAALSNREATRTLLVRDAQLNGSEWAMQALRTQEEHLHSLKEERTLLQGRRGTCRPWLRGQGLRRL